jgi:hypothetical protein
MALGQEKLQRTCTSGKYARTSVLYSQIYSMEVWRTVAKGFPNITISLSGHPISSHIYA